MYARQNSFPGRVAEASAALLRRFSRDTRGVSAIEFAFVFPLMIFVYVASIDVTMVITADRRVTNISSAISDLVGQATVINNDEMDDIFAAAAEIIRPMPTTDLSIVVTSVVADEDNNTTVDWSDAYNGGAATPGSAAVVPDGLTVPDSSVIVATVTYTYESPTAQFLSGEPITVDETFYIRPRRTAAVARID